VLFSQLPNLGALEQAGAGAAAVSPAEIHMAFRPLFALAALVLAIALAAFHQMPQKALRTSVKVSDAMQVE